MPEVDYVLEACDRLEAEVSRIRSELRSLLPAAGNLEGSTQHDQAARHD